MEVAPHELAQLLKLAGVGVGPEPEVMSEPDMPGAEIEPEVSVMAIPSDDGAPVGGGCGAPEPEHDHDRGGEMRSIIDMLKGGGEEPIDMLQGAGEEPIEVEESPPKDDYENASNEFTGHPVGVVDTYDQYSYEPAKNSGMQRRTNSYGDNPLREEELIKEYTEFKKKPLTELETSTFTSSSGKASDPNRNTITKTGQAANDAWDNSDSLEFDSDDDFGSGFGFDQTNQQTTKPKFTNPDAEAQWNKSNTAFQQADTHAQKVATYKQNNPNWRDQLDTGSGGNTEVYKQGSELGNMLGTYAQQAIPKKNPAVKPAQVQAPPKQAAVAASTAVKPAQVQAPPKQAAVAAPVTPAGASAPVAPATPQNQKSYEYGGVKYASEQQRHQAMNRAAQNAGETPPVAAPVATAVEPEVVNPEAAKMMADQGLRPGVPSPELINKLVNPKTEPKGQLTKQNDITRAEPNALSPSRQQETEKRYAELFPGFDDPLSGMVDTYGMSDLEIAQAREKRVKDKELELSKVDTYGTRGDHNKSGETGGGMVSKVAPPTKPEPKTIEVPKPEPKPEPEQTAYVPPTGLLPPSQRDKAYVPPTGLLPPSQRDKQRTSAVPTQELQPSTQSASVDDLEGPESVGAGSRDDRESKVVADIRARAKAAGLQDPYAGDSERLANRGETTPTPDKPTPEPEAWELPDKDEIINKGRTPYDPSKDTDRLGGDTHDEPYQALPGAELAQEPSARTQIDKYIQGKDKNPATQSDAEAALDAQETARSGGMSPTDRAAWIKKQKELTGGYVSPEEKAAELALDTKERASRKTPTTATAKPVKKTPAEIVSQYTDPDNLDASDLTSTPKPEPKPKPEPEPKDTSKEDQVSTGAGGYPIYRKGSPTAKQFQKAYATAPAGKNFDWKGRPYSKPAADAKAQGANLGPFTNEPSDDAPTDLTNVGTKVVGDGEETKASKEENEVANLEQMLAPHNIKHMTVDQISGLKHKLTQAKKKEGAGLTIANQSLDQQDTSANKRENTRTNVNRFKALQHTTLPTHIQQATIDELDNEPKIDGGARSIGAHLAWLKQLSPAAKKEYKYREQYGESVDVGLSRNINRLKFLAGI